jgi:hypothetical protein
MPICFEAVGGNSLAVFQKSLLLRLLLLLLILLLLCTVSSTRNIRTMLLRTAIPQQRLQRDGELLVDHWRRHRQTQRIMHYHHRWRLSWWFFL